MITNRKFFRTIDLFLEALWFFFEGRIFFWGRQVFFLDAVSFFRMSTNRNHVGSLPKMLERRVQRYVNEWADHAVRRASHGSDAKTISDKQMETTSFGARRAAKK